MLEKILALINGKKTYVIAFLLAALTFARHMNWIDDAAYNQVFALLSASGLATMRAAIK